MKKEIEEFEKQNGSLVNYTVKELVGGLNIKIDRILERLEKGEIRFTNIETNLKWHKRLILTLYGLVGAFLIKPMRSILQKLFGG